MQVYRRVSKFFPELKIKLVQYSPIPGTEEYLNISNRSELTAEPLLQNNSAFQSIEGRTLASSDVHFEPTLTRDACYRKAGSV